MRRPLLSAAACTLLFLTYPTPASADRVFTVFFGGTPSAANGFLDLADTAGSSKPAWGASLGRVGNVMGWEVDAFASPGFFSSGSSGLELVSGSQASAVMLNAMISAPRHWMSSRVRPYAVGGAGLMKARIDDVAGLFPTDRMLGGFNVGAGVFLLPWRHGGVRGDARYYRSQRKEDPEATLGFGPAFLDLWRVSAGAVLRF